MPSINRLPGRLDALALGAVALAGSVCLAMPFWGDQALFTLYARELTQGAVLYRDLVDIKQPGIFWFYAIGGLLFGFTEVGIHLFELVWWLAFSLFVVVTLPAYLATRWGPPLVPVFTVAAYYLQAGLLDLGQVEILVGFPLLVAWWLIDQGDPATRRGVRRYAAAGLAAAAVVLLKHLYLLIVLAFLGYAVLRSLRRGSPMAGVGRSLGAFFMTLAAPLLVVIAYFAAHGQLERIWWLYFEMAPAAQLFTPRPLEYLLAGMRRFMIGHAPILILAAVGCVHAFRGGRPPRLNLVIGMLLWGAAGAIAFIGIQGWPEYKWALFTIPLGILAVVGAEAVAACTTHVSRTSRRLAVAAGTLAAIVSVVLGLPAPEIQTQLLVTVVIGVCAGIAMVLLPGHLRASGAIVPGLALTLGVAAGLSAIAPTVKVRALVEHEFALTLEARTEFQRSWNGFYRAADQDLEVLRNGNPQPGPIYVFGDPVLLLRANRRQAVPILGWGPEFLDGRAWEELHSDLRAALPPYIIIDTQMQSSIRGRCPAIMELIESRYAVAFVGVSGTWYELRGRARP